MYSCFLDTNNVRSDFEYKEKRQYDEHISHKTQKCKCIQLTLQAEIMKINSLHPLDLKKNVLGANSVLIDIFKNHYDEDVCIFH